MGNTEQIITQFFRSYEKLTQIFPQKRKKKKVTLQKRKRKENLTYLTKQEN